MLELNRFKSMNELLKHQRNLFTAFRDNSIYEETKDRISYELFEICELLGDATVTNRRLLEVLLEVINNREDEYQLQVIAGIKNHERVYTFNDFEHIEISEKNNPMYWNAVVITKKGVDVMDLTKERECSAMFFRPDIYADIYKNKLFILYDAFIGNVNVDVYLNSEVCISKLLDLSETYGLNEKEVAMLNIKVLDLYKKAYVKSKSNVKTKTRKQ